MLNKQAPHYNYTVIGYIQDKMSHSQDIADELIP